MVIGRAAVPHAFKKAHVNKSNLPVTYRNNRKAWMLSGIWYEYLRELNTEMQQQKRRIALITDNCPLYPRPNQPPKDYDGPQPPTLTNITLIYLPRNTTPYFQPLDQGIIQSFKAAYRRKYAQHLVNVFNSTNSTPPPIDILQAIHFISEAWQELPPAIIYNCWKEAGIHSKLQKTGTDTQKSYSDYMEYLKTGTSISVSTLLDPTINSYHSNQMNTIIIDYLFHEEEAVDPLLSPSIISISELIMDLQEEASKSTELGDPEIDDNTILELYSSPPLQLPTTTKAIEYLTALQSYLESLSITHFPHPSIQDHSIPIVDFVSQFQTLNLALQTYQISQKKQSTLEGWIQVKGNL